MTQNEQKFVEQFIKSEMEHYEKPKDRKGTPRGEPLGPSKKKYMASLYCAIGYKLKHISMKLNIPYGTLRNWNCKDHYFCKLVKEKRDNFFDRVPNIDIVLRLEKIISDLPIGSARKREAMLCIKQLEKK